MRHLVAGIFAAALVAAGGPVGAEGGVVNCADAPYNGTIGGIVRSNVEVTAYPGVCLITGTVQGNVTARNGSDACDQGYPPVTAINVVGGTVDGNVLSAGGDCVMIWLRDGARVTGNAIHRSQGNLGFLGNGAGAVLEGNAILHGGHLFASGASTTNAVGGSVICNGGAPAGGGTATETDWDADGTFDGHLGQRSVSC